MTLGNPTKNLRIESWQRFKWYIKLAQVGTSWHKWNKWNLQIYVEQVEQEQGGLQIDVEQVGQEQVTVKWSVQMNLST